MSAQITAGPWMAVAWNCHAATTIKAGDVVVAECSGFGRYAAESIADARLIAAAPDLLEALQMAKHIVADEGTDEQMAQVFAAIEKATGSTS